MADDKSPGGDKEPSGNSWMKSLFIWAGIILALALVVQIVGGGASATQGTLAYSDFLAKVDEGGVRSVAIGKESITGRLADNSVFHTNLVPDPTLTQRLAQKNVRFDGAPEPSPSLWMLLLYQSLPFLLILGIAFFVMRQMQKNAGSGAMGFGRSKAKLLTEKHGRVTFDDVAGIDEAREELQEIVEFLKDPTKFARLGGKIPKGALLVGSPGTGKTLLARAIAGEANVPFFTISGSDFVEMFV